MRIGRDGRSTEVGEADPAVDEDECLGVDPQVGDLRRVEPGECLPRATKERLVQSLAVERCERLRLTPQNEEGVVVDRRRGRHDVATRDAGIAGQQRHECLVFGCVQAARADRGSRASVPRAAPESRDDLVVGRVTAIDLHEEGAALTVDSPDTKDACRLLLLRLESACLNAELRQRGRDGVEPRAPGRGSEEQVHGRSGDHADEHRGEHAAGRSRSGDRCADDAENEHPAPERAEWPDEVRRDRRDHRDRGGDSNIGEFGRSRGSEERVGHVWPRVDCDASCDHSDHDADDQPRDGLTDDEEPAAYERGRPEYQRPEPDEVGEKRPDGVEPVRDR